MYINLFQYKQLKYVKYVNIFKVVYQLQTSCQMYHKRINHLMSSKYPTTQNSGKNIYGFRHANKMLC